MVRPAPALWGVLAALLVSAPAWGLEVPPLAGRVNDTAKLLSPSQREALEARLQAHEASTQQQFVVLTIPSLEGDPIEDFSLRVVEAWKPGQKKIDNGLLLLVVPNDRKVRIEVGYGLEDKITDALSKRIIVQIVGPAFRAGDYAGGIAQALDALMQAGGGEPVRALRSRGGGSRDEGFGPGTLLFFVVMLLVVGILLGRGRGGPWGGGFGGGGFGGGGFGGGGGGGFSGGGGGFGGGGSSGSW